MRHAQRRDAGVLNDASANPRQRDEASEQRGEVA
jgi:hypothetical protein